jgi:hypothetical protein
MPDGVQAIDPDEFEWHDGHLVDLQLARLAGKARQLPLTPQRQPISNMRE